jgi:hypothetical protein
MYYCMHSWQFLDNFKQYDMLKFNKFANFNCIFVNNKKENELDKINKTLLPYTCN